MFTIVISEKGGAERRETFEKNEINVGRVQGNDLMLPKGNVSKHHARLLYRDGRFIVTDLKSTNGTYVNGRKISQATIVREGDKIYIGDFVVRLEVAPRVGEPPADAASPVEAGELLPAPPPAAAASSPRVSEPAAPGRAAGSNADSSPDLAGEPSAAAAAAAPPTRGIAPPPSPTSRGRGPSMGLESRTIAGRAVEAGSPAPPRVSRSLPPPAARAAPAQAARRLALVTLIDRLADVLDLSALDGAPAVADTLAQAIDRAAREQARQMRDEGEAPEGVEAEALVRDAVRELVGLGALGPLLDDADAVEIDVLRPDCVLALKNGRTVLAEPSFTSEAAVARAVGRLAAQSGEALRGDERVVDRRLARGASMTAIAPAVAGGWVVHVRKAVAVETSLAELVRAGGASEPVAAMLDTCAKARANVLVVGSDRGAMTMLLGALVASSAPGDKIALLARGPDEIAAPHAHLLPLSLGDHGARGEQAVYAAARLDVDRLVVDSLGGAVATATIDVIAEGSEGVVAGAGAPTLDHGLARIASQISMSRAGLSIEAARAALGASFDVAVEVGRRPNGRPIVRRVAELSANEDGLSVRDVFVLAGGESADPVYVTAGVSRFASRSSGAA